MTTSTGITFDPYDYALQDDPYPVYRRLRDEEPLHHNVEHDFWVLSRHADVHRALRSGDVLSNAMGVSMDESAWSPYAHQTMSFLAMDAPRHTRLRKLVSRGFTPRRVAELEEQTQHITDGYLDAALASGTELDWIRDVAGRLPMDVISQMLGVPAADRDELRRLADLLVHREPGLRDVPQVGIEAALTLFGYYEELIALRRRRPADDLVSALLAAEDGGERMTDGEIVAFLFLMVVAGNETTTKLLGNAVFHLARDGAQHEELFGSAEAGLVLVGPWIEETLRHDNSTQLLARHLREDVTLHGVTAPAGAKLLLGLGAANRDERAFTDPETFDVHRDEAELRRSVSFGGGPHFCLGANLARLESRVALAELVRRTRRIEPDEDRAVRFYSANVRGFAELPMRVTLR